MGKKNEDAAVQKNELSPQSEDKFRAIFEGASEGILVADAKTRKLILANSRICEITGYSQEELLKLSVNDIHPKKDLPRVISEFTKQVQRKIITTKDMPVLRKDKGVVYCDINSKVVKISGRECLVGFFSNITERKKANDALKQSEQNLSQIIQGSPIATFVIDTNHKVLQWNMACEALTGIPFSRVVGKDNHWSAFYKEKRPVMADLIVDGANETKIEKFYEGKSKKSSVVEEAYEAEKFFLNLGKEGKWLFITAAPLKNSKGQIIGATETLQDITNRKNAENTLKVSEEKYKMLVENATDQIFLLDRDLKFISLNSAVAKLLRRPANELIGKPIFEVFPKEISAQFSKNCREVFRTGKTKSVEEKISVNGRNSYSSTVLTPVKNENGDMSSVMGIVRDITERKKAEEGLIKSKAEIERRVEERTKKLKMLYESLEKQNKTIIKRQIELAEAKKNLEDRNYELNDVKDKLQEQGSQLEKQVSERTAELNKKVEELERFNRLAVGRELKMIELKKRIAELESARETSQSGNKEV